MMQDKTRGLFDMGNTESLLPKEEMLELAHGHQKFSIGIPKEIQEHERRIPLVPEAVHLLTERGHTIYIESNAGHGARFSDHEYAESGGQIVSSASEVFKADLILKVAAPTIGEVEQLRDRQNFISAGNFTVQDKACFRSLMQKKITAIAYELIRDKLGTYPVRRSLSEIVGNTSIIIAARYLSDPEYGRGAMLGGFPGVSPTEVVIIGAGTVAEFAARAAIGMGASVFVFDYSVSRLRRIQTLLNYRISTSVLQPEVLAKRLLSADVVIGAIHSYEGRSPVVVTESMITSMKLNAVAIDISIDQGGCFETSRPTGHDKPVFKASDVIHYCVPNIASSVPRTASYALSNFFGPALLQMGEAGGIDKLIRSDRGLCDGVYLYKGVLTKKFLGEAYGLPFQDINLLLASFQ